MRFQAGVPSLAREERDASQGAEAHIHGGAQGFIDAFAHVFTRRPQQQAAFSSRCFSSRCWRLRTVQVT